MPINECLQLLAELSPGMCLLTPGIQGFVFGVTHGFVLFHFKGRGLKTKIKIPLKIQIFPDDNGVHFFKFSSSSINHPEAKDKELAFKPPSHCHSNLRKCWDKTCKICKKCKNML
jgi:hypothetical protein